MQHILWAAVAMLLSFIGVVGDYFVKLSSKGPRYIEWRWLCVGAAIYASTALGWFFPLKHSQLAALGVIYGVSTVLFLALMGLIYFKQTLYPSEVIGMIFGIISLILLVRFA